MNASLRIQSLPHRRQAGVALWVGVLLITIGGTSWAGPIEGVSYSLMPAAEWAQWHENLALEDGVLYGGRLGLNFGRYITLRGYYLQNPDLRTDFSAEDLGEGIDPADVNQDVSVTNYGADVMLNLSWSNVTPFVNGGAGVLLFEPDQGLESKQIGVRLGGGLRLGFSPRVEALLYVEDNMFRVNRALLLGEDGSGDGAVLLADGEDADSDDLNHNLVFGAGLNFLLGGYDRSRETDLDRAYRRQFAGGLSGASFKIEPHAGWVDYDKSFGLGDQRFAGIRAGMGLGQLVDLLGYYWRGVEDDFGSTEPVQSWGGEARFRLSSGSGVTPNLVIGAGSLDFMADFLDETGNPRDDKMTFIAGGGIGFHLGRRLNVCVDIRDYMFSESELTETVSPDEILHNWTYSAGLVFGLGGGGGDSEHIESLGRERWRTEPPADAAAGEAQGASVPAETPEASMTETPDAAATPAAPTAIAPSAPAPAPETPATEPAARVPAPGEPLEIQMASPVRTYQGDRVVTLPVPTTGEIYIRYGAPGGVSIESKIVSGEAPAAVTVVPGETTAAQPVAPTPAEMEEAVRAAVRTEMTSPATPGEAAGTAPTQATPLAGKTADLGQQLAEFEQRLLAKLDERIEQKVASEVARRTGVEAPASATPFERDVVSGAPRSVRPRHLLTYTGANVDDPNQFILGLRLDTGPVGGNRNIAFLPELALGLFNERSIMLAANLQWNVGETLQVDWANPYLYGGAGLLIFNEEIDGRDKMEGVFNIGYGISKDFDRWTGFLEHQGVDLFSLHRLLVGARIRI